MFKDLKHLLLISDLDGTLLPSDKRIPPEDLEIIRQFQAAGGRFTIATGRTYEAASVYLEQVQPNAPVILYNGAMLFDPVKKQPIATLPLASSVRQIVRELLDWNPDMGAEILTADGIYVIRLNAAGYGSGICPVGGCVPGDPAGRGIQGYGHCPVSRSAGGQGHPDCRSRGLRQ